MDAPDRDRDSVLEEERRLACVGMTRARSELFLSAPQVIGRGRRVRTAEPSPFLDEIPDELLTVGGRGDGDAGRCAGRAGDAEGRHHGPVRTRGAAVKGGSWNARAQRHRRREHGRPAVNDAEWYRRFDRLPARGAGIRGRGNDARVLNLAEGRGPAAARTVKWLTNEVRRRGRRQNSYQSVALQRLLRTLTEETTAEPCENALHEWNLPGAGETELECFVCGRSISVGISDRFGSESVIDLLRNR